MKTKYPRKLLLCTALVAAFGAATAWAGDTASDEIWLTVYSSPRGAALTEMRPRVRVGPFPYIVICYSVGALSIDAMQHNPNIDVMARCGDGELLTLRQMTDRALALLPSQQAPGVEP